MAWERRHRSGRRFLYRAERHGDKIVKTYLGSQTNPLVQLAGRIDRNRRALAALNRDAERAEDSADRDRLLRAGDIRAALIKKLIRRTIPMRESTVSRPDSSHGAECDDMPAQAEFLAIVHRAESGSERAQGEVRRILDRHPQLWRAMGDLGSLAEGYLIDLASRHSFVLQESLRRKLDEYRAQLSRKQNDSLEGFLVHRVLVSWLEVEVRQIQTMQAQSEIANRKHQRRLDQAQRRHADSINALRAFQGDSQSGNEIAPAAADRSEELKCLTCDLGNTETYCGDTG